MLNKVPQHINRAARTVVLRHPNAWPAFVYRKAVTRTNTPSEEMGGAQTLGGMGVLSSEDEDEVTWSELGYAAVLVAEPYQGGRLSDRDDAIDATAAEFLVLIEPVAEPGSEGYFTVKQHDVTYILIGEGVKIAFEVIRIEGNVSIPPYTRRYVLNKRDDLSFVEAFQDVKP